MADEKPPTNTTKPSKAADQLLVCGELPDQPSKLAVLRHRKGRLEAGVMQAMQEGQALSPKSELVELKQNAQHDALYDVVKSTHIAQEVAHAGPARISSAAYRTGWDDIWGLDEAERAPKLRPEQLN